MDVKLIWQKEKNGIFYWLKYFISTKQFILYAENSKILQQEISFVPEIGIFKTKEGADIFFENIK